MGIFIDLSDEEVLQEIRNLTDEHFFIEKDGCGYIACIMVEGSEEWLPDNYGSQSVAYRKILAELVGFESSCYHE